MTSSVQQDPQHDLDVGLSASVEVNRVIVAADAKAGLVLAAHGAVLAGMASILRSGPGLPPPMQVSATAISGAAGIVVLLLVASLWPRTAEPIARWFAYPALRPAVDGEVPERPGTEALAEQAWAQALALAAIARRKYRWFRAALVVGTADLVGFCAFVAVVAGSGQP